MTNPEPSGQDHLDAATTPPQQSLPGKTTLKSMTKNSHHTAPTEPLRQDYPGKPRSEHHRLQVLGPRLYYINNDTKLLQTTRASNIQTKSNSKKATQRNNNKTLPQPWPTSAQRPIHSHNDEPRAFRARPPRRGHHTAPREPPRQDHPGKHDKEQPPHRPNRASQARLPWKA
jgi:hypothetical protein